MKVILMVEGRNKVLHIGGDDVDALRKDFTEMCDNDPVLRQRIKTHYPTFTSFNETVGLELELEMEDTLKDGQKVGVYFASFAVNDSEEGGTAHSAPGTSTQPSKGDTSNSERDYLKLIGMRVGTGGTKKGNGDGSHGRGPSVTASNSSRPTNSKPATGPRSTKSLRRKTNTNDVTEIASDDDEQNDYLLASETARVKNVSALKELNIENVSTTFGKPTKRVALKAKKKKQQQKTGDENTTTAPTRSQPLRAVRSKKNIGGDAQDKITASDFEEKQSSDDEPIEDGHDQDQAPLLQNDKDKNQNNLNTRKRAGKIRRKPAKRRRRIGETITMNTPLPPFPDGLKESIAKCLVYEEQAHTQRMNDFLKAHVRNITKDSYPTIAEYDVLKTQVASRLRTQNVPNVEVYEEHLVRSLSASFRNDRNWENNRKARYMAAKQLLHMAQSTGIPTPPAAAALNALDADIILKNTVRNKETVKSALVAAAFITTENIQKVTLEGAMDMYPYLKESDLLMLDFTIKVESSLERFEQNFENAMLPLVKLFQADESPEDELAKAKLILKVSEYFEPKEPMFPCFQMCDVAITSNEVLESIPRGQAPALIFTVNDKDLVSAILVFDQEPLYTITTPRAFECVVMLLAVYFIYNIRYPNVYEKTLITLEHIMLGETRISKISKQVKSFFRKFFEAKKQ